MSENTSDSNEPGDQTFPAIPKGLETVVPDGFATLPSGIPPHRPVAKTGTPSPAQTAQTNAIENGLTIYPDSGVAPPSDANTPPLFTAPVAQDPGARNHETWSNANSNASRELLPTERNQGVIPDKTNLPTNVVANYDTVAPSEVFFDALDATILGTEEISAESPGGQNFSKSHAETLRTPRYCILREHAKGGLGKVFVAEDLELQREVAFKEIQRKYANDRETQIRFLREAKITGGLEHPGIVPIYGLGTYPDGRPYYAMRFIRGQSLQQAIEAHYRPKLPTRDEATRHLEFRKLLRRFIDVCNALEYAHAQGIIHRDLKPGNIMLGEFGETLVVDWGLAKSFVSPEPEVGSDSTRSTPRSRLSSISGDGAQTQAGTMVGTPQFMSPEQALGQEGETGPASDIYSLGATLYAILTGTGAFTGRTIERLVEQVVDGDFPPPQLVQPDLANSLNAICLKAMARRPENRYQSAAALAEDLEHWLADEPVDAYPETRGERISRWIRKHQARAQAIVLTIIVVAIVSIGAALLIEQSRRSEAAAKQESLRRTRETRETVDTMLSGLSEGLENFPNMLETRSRLLKEAVAAYGKLAEDNSQNPELQAEAARNLVRHSDVRLQLNPQDANAVADYTKATDIFRKLSQNNPAIPDYTFEMARSEIQRAVALANLGQHQAAQQGFQDSAALLQPLVQKYAEQVEYQDALATSLIGAGRASNTLDEPQAAEQLLTEGLQRFDLLRTRLPKDLRIATAQTNALSAKGTFLLDRGRAGDAVKLYEQSLEIHADIISGQTENPEFYANQATVRINLANALRSLGRWSEASRNYESAISDYQELVQARQDVPRYLENLAVARTNWGQVARRLGRNPEAIKALETALMEFNDLRSRFPEFPPYVERTAKTRVTLAQLQSELGNQKQALTTIDDALLDYGELLALDPKSSTYQEDSAIAVSNRGRIVIRDGDLPGGLTLLKQAIETLKPIPEREPATPRYRDNLALAWTHLGYAELEAQQKEAAKAAFQAALDSRRQLLAGNPQSPQFQDAALAWLLATCPLEELQNLSESIKLATSATTTVPESPLFQLTLGVAQLMNNEPAKALEALAQSREQLKQADGLTLYVKALCEFKLRQADAARQTFESAKAWRQKNKPADEELIRWERRVENEIR